VTGLAGARQPHPTPKALAFLAHVGKPGRKIRAIHDGLGGVADNVFPQPVAHYLYPLWLLNLLNRPIIFSEYNLVAGGFFDFRTQWFGGYAAQIINQAAV